MDNDKKVSALGFVLKQMRQTKNKSLERMCKEMGSRWTVKHLVVCEDTLNYPLTDNDIADIETFCIKMNYKLPQSVLRLSRTPVITNSPKYYSGLGRHIDIKVNRTYRHYKGNLYTVIAECKHSETGSPMIVYKGTDETWCTLKERFSDIVTDKNGNEVLRFTLQPH